MFFFNLNICGKSKYSLKCGFLLPPTNFMSQQPRLTRCNMHHIF